MRKAFAILTLALAALLAVPGAASADHDGDDTPDSYQAQTAPGQVDPGTVTDGGTVTFSGCGFAPGATVTIAEDGQREGTVTAGSNGCFSTTVTVNGAGSSVLTATGADADGGTLTVTATVRVLAASGGTGGLAATGADGTTTQVWAGIGLLGLGAGMVALTVSRRRFATSPSTIA